MKLIYCKECHDVIGLRDLERHCDCGQSGGRYDNQVDATIHGPCIPLGFDNRTFIHAVQNQPEDGLGDEFTAFVIPRQCETISRTHIY